MKEFLYHGQAVGFEADIWEPGPHKADHARCGLPDKKAGHYRASEKAFEIPGLMSHGGCSTEVIAHPEDKDGFFRTEVHATVDGLNVEGGALTIDRITLGMVSLYRRHWFECGKPHALRVRVLPYGCRLENVQVRGAAVKEFLPAPFHYSLDRCESYLRADDPDEAVESEIRDAITTSSARFLHVKNFGRIYFGEWTLLPNTNWHPIHQIYMVRLSLGSPQTGNGGNGGGQTDGAPGGG